MPFQVMPLVIVSFLIPLEIGASRATPVAGHRGVFRYSRLQTTPQDSSAVDDEASVAVSPQEATKSAMSLPALPPSSIVEDEEQETNGNRTPQLASVSSVLEGASVTLKGLAIKTKVLKGRLFEVQAQSSRKLLAQRAAFETRLRTQKDGNDALISANAKISNVVNALKQENQALRDAAGKLEESNRFKRKELQTLQSRIKYTQNFFMTALRESDDSHASQLVVLGEESEKDSTEKSLSIFQHSVTTQKNIGHESSQELADEDNNDDDDDDHATSFLAESSQVWRSEEGMSAAFEAAEALRRVDDDDTTAPVATDEVVPSVSETPEQLLGDLEKGVKSLEAEQKDGEAKLKAKFIELFRSGHHKQVTLTSQQKALNKTKDSLLFLQNRLQIANDHLKGTERTLMGKIHSIGVFLKRIAHAALAPSKEATQALRDLPNAVDSGDRTSTE
eukprot:TRINITY_DN1189_c0_g1_i3.p1 TRINITY_DN1189_c0_g1~~TRINITY_DN1189_c0_g1_i3.p1  ORF type:complete len:448 (-),score=109.53 TRINITY_DN1189_c0_g1_i3:160-1503(-)